MRGEWASVAAEGAGNGLSTAKGIPYSGVTLDKSGALLTISFLICKMEGNTVVEAKWQGTHLKGFIRM